MLFDPLLRIVTAPRWPVALATDVREDTTAQTTYTFTACNLGDLGGNRTIIDGNSLGANTVHTKMRSRKVIYVIVHGEDALATFSVTGVTIGGVAGTERTDRGGGTTAINTAIYIFPTSTLDGITNTDIAVTWDEAVTGCAIGVVLVEGLGQITTGANTGSGTGNIDISTPGNDGPNFIVVGTSCVTGGGTETPAMTCVGLFVGNFEPQLLYHGSNANFDYAAFYAFSPLLTTHNFGGRVTWSGTGGGDLAWNRIDAL